MPPPLLDAVATAGVTVDEDVDVDVDGAEAVAEARAPLLTVECTAADAVTATTDGTTGTAPGLSHCVVMVSRLW